MKIIYEKPYTKKFIIKNKLITYSVMRNQIILN